MLCIIQSRMSSNRLPGKMMIDLLGKSVISRVIERVLLSEKITKIVVATSIQRNDDIIESFCKEKGIEFFRGDLDNVSDRFYKVLMIQDAKSFVRINGDSPLIDPKIIDFAIDKFNGSDYDIITNVFPRTFPKGQSVEAVRTDAFIRLIDSGLNSAQKEHVTKKFYDSPENYKILNFNSGGDYNYINMCIDNFSDKLRLEKVIEKAGHKELSWIDLSKFF